jgi:hypothetical protein
MGVSYCLVNTGGLTMGRCLINHPTPLPTTQILPQEFSDLFEFDRRHPDFEELHNLLLECDSNDDDTTFTLTILHQYDNDDLIPDSPMARLVELAKHCEKSGYDWAFHCWY